ncbi:MAG: hypothetical protein KID00_10460 [Clostridium argentinense]|nr:hypothetical protein [Clostridium butanoliproducens]MBS5824262.1 hypothetical protein [Clostridium argentinense]MDU1350842.1 hypothetical protein [Clostridium argentinense]
MKKLQEIIDLLSTNLLIIVEKISKSLYKVYNDMVFNFNKQNTIKKMFEPTIDKKEDINKKLLNNLKSLKSENEKIDNKINFVKKDNSKIEEKIKILELLLTEQNHQ